jgi:glycosyltransferase involved in cell wall biosynthesis
MNVPTYSIVIPAYNESKRLAASIEMILAFIVQQGWDAEVLVVNDGSRDDTSAIVKNFALRDDRVRLLENPGNRGKGYSVRNGMLHARGELLIFTDADLSSPIAEAAKLAEAIRAGADIAIGSRWKRPELMTKRQPKLRQLLGRIFNALLHILLGLQFRDTQCGLKMFTRQAALSIFPRQRIERWGFDPELLYLAERFSLQTVEIPVEWAHDERSKINPLLDGIHMFGEIIRIRWYALNGKYGRLPVWVAPNTATQQYASHKN